LWLVVVGGRFRDHDVRSEPQFRQAPMTRKKKSSSANPVKGPSQRMLRVGELIRHKIAEMLVRGDIHDDVIASHSITIPEVRLSPDMKLATVYVMPLGGKSMKPVIEALTRNKTYIRTEVAHTLDLRYAPDLRFHEDKTFEEATRIDRLLDSPHVRQDIDKK
jgi:ribosome-binding factor A